MRVWGEDPHKIFNIVYSQLEFFRLKYSDAIDELPNIQLLRDGVYQVHYSHLQCFQLNLF